MKKNFFLIRNINPSLYGGAESYQIELAKILSKYGYRPIIITASKKLLQNAKCAGIKTIKAPYIKNQNWSGWRNILLPIYIVWQLYLYAWYKKKIKKYRPIAVDIQSRDEWIAATLAGKHSNIKIFWTDHIDFRTWALQNINVPRKNLIGKYIVRLMSIPHKIIEISDYEANWLKKQVKKSNLQNLVIIKNGVIDQRDEYRNIKPIKNSFCYVGRLIDYKGIKELIEAFGIVSAKFPDAKLNIYGDGQPKIVEKYYKMAEQNSNIIFQGYTDSPLKAIAGSEIFILPSYYEGLSIALIQASMLGKKIIATDIDGNPEVVIDQKTGLLVPIKDGRQLAKAMIGLLQNSKKASKLAKTAREQYQTNFDFEKTIKNKFVPLLEH